MKFSCSRHLSASLVALLFLIVLSPDIAHAQAAGGGGALFSSGTNFLQALQDLLTNTWVRIIGVIAVAVLGIAWMVGRVSFVWAASVTCGLVIAFSAAAIVGSVEGVI